MDAFLNSIFRWIFIATLFVFGEFKQSESFILTREPANPTVVVEGVNSTQVELVWNFTATPTFFVGIFRQRPGDFQSTQIAAQSDSSGEFQILEDAFNAEYKAHLPATLVIKDVNRTDEYVYSFSASNSFGVRKLFDQVTIDVLFASEFINVSSDKVAVEGESLPSFTLSCIAEGSPTPTITWTRVLDNGSDSTELFPSGEQLVLDNNRNTTGTYRCTAYNGIGTAPNRTVNVDVNYPPENVQLVTSAVDNKACQGGVISINCSADANPSVETYELLENDIVIFNNSGRWSKTFATEGVFIYKCVANNSVGTGQSESVTVTVNVPPAIHQIQNETITEGGSLTLSCQATGTPPLMVSWFKPDGQRVDVSELPLTNISRNEAGEYRCEASNECGNASQTAIIDVQYPSSIVFLRNLTVEKGQTVTLFCNVSGRPTPSVSWTHVRSGKKRLSNTWAITDIEVNDLGQYRCDASNIYGNDSKSTFIYFEDAIAKVVIVSLKIINKVWIEEFEDLNNPETQAFAGEIKDSIIEKLDGTGITDVKVTKLR